MFLYPSLPKDPKQGSSLTGEPDKASVLNLLGHSARYLWISESAINRRSLSIFELAREEGQRNTDATLLRVSRV